MKARVRHVEELRVAPERAGSGEERLHQRERATAEAGVLAEDEQVAHAPAARS